MKQKQLLCTCLAITMAFGMSAQAVSKSAQNVRALIRPIFAVSAQAFGAESTETASATTDNSTTLTPAPSQVESSTPGTTVAAPATESSNNTANESVSSETPTAPTDSGENQAPSVDSSVADTENSSSVQDQPADLNHEASDSQPESLDTDNQTPENPSDADNRKPDESETSEPSAEIAENPAEAPEQPIESPEQPSEDTQGPAPVNPETPADTSAEPDSSTNADNESGIPEAPDDSENKPSESAEDAQPVAPDIEASVEEEKLQESPAEGIPEQPTEEIPEELPTEALAEEIPEPEDSSIINVVIPSMGQVVLNPYRMNVSLNGSDYTDQIVNEAQVFTNYSNVPVQIKANAVGITQSGSEVIFVSQPPSADAADKEVFIYIEFHESSNGTASAPWSGVYTGDSNQILVCASESDKEPVITLPTGDVNPSHGVYKLFGATAVNPSKMWTINDTIHVTVSFTFCPMDVE